MHFSAIISPIGMAEVAAGDGAFRTCSIRSVSANRKSWTSVPSASLFDRSGSPAVWVVNQASSVVTLRTIAIDRYEADRIVVAQGLDKGEIVVTAGVNRLRENQIVKLTQRSEQ